MFVVSYNASKRSYFARICCSYKDDLSLFNWTATRSRGSLETTDVVSTSMTRSCYHFLSGIERSGGFFIGLTHTFGSILHSSLHLWRLLTPYPLWLLQTLSVGEASRGDAGNGHLIYLPH